MLFPATVSLEYAYIGVECCRSNHIRWQFLLYHSVVRPVHFTETELMIPVLAAHKPLSTAWSTPGSSGCTVVLRTDGPFYFTLNLKSVSNGNIESGRRRLIPTAALSIAHLISKLPSPVLGFLYLCSYSRQVNSHSLPLINHMTHPPNLRFQILLNLHAFDTPDAPSSPCNRHHSHPLPDSHFFIRPLHSPDFVRIVR